MSKPEGLLVASDRRGFLKGAGIGALALAGSGLLAKGAHAQGGASNIDVDVVNFALNLEYLEAEYYSFATTGQSIQEFFNGGTSGVNSPAGNPGPVTIKDNPQVPFTSDDVRQMAREITADERNHVALLRSALTSVSGGTRTILHVGRPAIDLKNSFAAAGALIGVPGFDPFANDLAFLLGAFIFEDVGVTAYKGAAPLLTSKDVLETAAGVLAVEAYHAGAIRTLLYQQRATMIPGTGLTVADAVQRISDLRDRVDALDGSGNPGDDLDQGITFDPFAGVGANIVPADSFSVAFSRTPASVLRIVYLGGAPGEGGGFFPRGLNGNIR